MKPPGIPAPVGEAAARARRAAQDSLKEFRRKRFSRLENGYYGRPQILGKSNQVTIPAEVSKRWGGQGIRITVLDLEWAILVVPDEEARSLLQDLGLGVEESQDP